LRNALEMAGVIAYDEMMCQLMFKRSIAGCKIKNAKDIRAVEDCEVSAIQEWMQRHDVRRISKETVQQAVDLVGHENKFHPVLDYLNGLKWDNVPRLNGFLAKYFNCTEQDKEYLAKIGRWFLISMVARIADPGGKCDYMIVLEGEQGLMKSTACGILGDKWFDDTLPEIRGGDDVRVSQHLRGKWLIEVGELASIKAADAENLKTFLTRRNERYIPKYGHNEIHEPRRCVFVGTTNKHTWLCDETGGRRFWPVRVGDVIDLDGLKRDRDQLFAEAVVAYRAKEAFWPTREFEAEFIKPEQERRYVEDAWEAKIDAWLNPTSKPRNRVTINETAVLALNIDLRA
jgi:predicted P-loop ATPase